MKDGWAGMIEKIDLVGRLDRRREVSIEEYEDINYRNKNAICTSGSMGTFVFNGIENEERKYVRLCKSS